MCASLTTLNYFIFLILTVPRPGTASQDSSLGLNLVIFWFRICTIHILYQTRNLDRPIRAIHNHNYKDLPYFATTSNKISSR